MTKRTRKSEAVDPSPWPEHVDSEEAAATASAAAEPDDAHEGSAADAPAPEATPKPVTDPGRLVGMGSREQLAHRLAGGAPPAPDLRPALAPKPFKRDPRCDEQKRHVAWCGCQGAARGPIA